MDNKYDLFIEENKICLDGDINETTDFDLHISETGREVTAKITNFLNAHEIIKLKGLGKRKEDGTYGDAYLSFANVYINKKDYENIQQDCNTSNKKEYEYKFIDGVFMSDIERIINEYSEDNWECVSIQPIIDRIVSSTSPLGELELTPDYDYCSILLRKEK